MRFYLKHAAAITRGKSSRETPSKNILHASVKLLPRVPFYLRYFKLFEFGGDFFIALMQIKIG